MNSRSLLAVPLFRAMRFACLAVALCAAPAWAADHASLINQAREELQNDRFLEALATSKDAIRASAGDYKGHYYAGLAYLGLGRFEDADESATRALQLAPETARAGVEKLVAAIKTRRQSTGGVKAAEAAVAEGLHGKAARLYEEAWAAGKDNSEIGFKAAEIYARKLSQPVDAARVLRQIEVAYRGAHSANRATSELSRLATPLREIAQRHVDASYGARCINALESLRKAEEADPSMLEIYKLRLQCTFGIDAAQKALKDLVKYDIAQPVEIAKLHDIQKLLKDPASAQAMTDVLGSAKVEQVNQLLRERRAKFDRQMAAYNEEVASYDQRVRAREQQMARNEASCKECQGHCKKNHGGFFGSAAREESCNSWCWGAGNWCGQKVKDVEKPVKPVEGDED